MTLWILDLFLKEVLFNKTYKLNHEIIEIDKEELEQDMQTENQIEQEQINKF